MMPKWVKIVCLLTLQLIGGGKLALLDYGDVFLKVTIEGSNSKQNFQPFQIMIGKMTIFRNSLI
jgi:hypothetical protein